MTFPQSSPSLEDPPEKEQWKATVHKAIYAHWENSLKKEAFLMSSLQYLNLVCCSVAKPHPAWEENMTNPHAITRATVQAHLLVMRYPLTGYLMLSKQMYVDVHFE